MRALCGHMRVHRTRGWKGLVPPQERCKAPGVNIGGNPNLDPKNNNLDLGANNPLLIHAGGGRGLGRVVMGQLCFSPLDQHQAFLSTLVATWGARVSRGRGQALRGGGSGTGDEVTEFSKRPASPEDPLDPPPRRPKMARGCLIPDLNEQLQSPAGEDSDKSGGVGDGSDNSEEVGDGSDNSGAAEDGSDKSGDAGDRSDKSGGAGEGSDKRRGAGDGSDSSGEVGDGSDKSGAAGDGSDKSGGAGYESDKSGGTGDGPDKIGGAGDGSDKSRGAGEGSDKSGGAGDGSDKSGGAGDGSDKRGGTGDRADKSRGAGDESDKSADAEDGGPGTAA